MDIESNYQDINWLKRHCQMIHAFGLGFIQLKLNDRYRLHFYTKNTAITSQPEEVHNHRYNFKSKILKGSLTNTVFDVVAGYDYQAVEESCRRDYKVVSQPVVCSIAESLSFTLKVGSHYKMNHMTYHKVSSDRAITLLTRDALVKPTATVIHHRDKELICPFSANLPVSDLWEIVYSEITDAY